MMSKAYDEMIINFSMCMHYLTTDSIENEPPKGLKLMHTSIPELQRVRHDIQTQMNEYENYKKCLFDQTQSEQLNKLLNQQVKRQIEDLNVNRVDLKYHIKHGSPGVS